MSLTKYLAIPLFLTLLIVASQSNAAATTSEDKKTPHDIDDLQTVKLGRFVIASANSDIPVNNNSNTRNESAEAADSEENTTFDTSKSIKRKDAEVAYQKAIKLKKEGNIGSALLELMKAVNNNPLLLDAYYQQALLFKEQGLHKLASSRLEQALAIDPEFNKARILLATIAIEQGNLNKAFNQLGKSLNKNSTATKKEKTSDSTIANLPDPQNIKKLNSKKSKSKKKLWKRKKRAKKKRNKKISRAKIRRIIAKRYKKFHKSYKKPRHHQAWYSRYTKMISWANPFKFNNESTQKNELFTENYKDLAPQESSIEPNPKPLLAKTHKLKSSKNEEAALDKIFESSRVNGIELVAPILELADTAEDSSENENITKSQSLASKNESNILKDQSQHSSITTNKGSTKTNPNQNLSNLLSTKFQQQKILQANIIGKKATLTFLPEVSSITGAPEIKEKVFSPPVNDKWTKKLIGLNENGTGSLKRGEAFMFSEDTGEAVLFLADGRRIRRIIAPSQSAERVVKLRRPDVLVPKELFYDVSLLGKVIGQKPEQKKNLIPSPKETRDNPPTFRMEKIMDESRTFVGAIRDVLRL